MQLRAISLADTAVIDLVAARMRATLVEVEGEDAGGAMYSMDWLRERVRWHLDGRAAEVVVAQDISGNIVGHTIYRVESEAATDPGPADTIGETPRAARFGLISTTYVLPEARRLGVAQRLLHRAEAWFVEQHALTSCTWTSATNTPLIALYAGNGYVEVERAPNQLTRTPMVRLAKPLTGERIDPSLTSATP